MDESKIPDDLKDKPRICPQANCRSTQLKFAYYASQNVNQPRLQCSVCKKCFTLGGPGKVRGATDGIQNQPEAASEDVGNQGVGSDAAQVKVPQTGDGPSVMKELDDTRRDKYGGKHPFEVVRDIIKTNLLDAQNILVHVDLVRDDRSRRISRKRRDEGEEILQKLKEILQDDIRGQVEVVGEEMATRSVAIEEAFHAIGTMRAQVESLDLGRISVYELHVLRKKAEFIKNYVMELTPFVSPSKKRKL